MSEGNPENVQSKAEKLKLLSLGNNIHNLTPPVQGNDSEQQQVAIVHALKSDNFTSKAYLKLKGLNYDPIIRKWTQYRRPVMNSLGIGNFMQVLENIGDTIEYSNFDKDDIPKFGVHLFEMNYPYFTIYYRDYELSKSDFNIISTLLFNFIMTSLYKAKGAGHRNVVRGVYSEDVLGKLVGGDPQQAKQGGLGSLLSRLNPMRRAS